MNYNVNGKVEKGPFVSGSTIDVQPMDANMQPLGSIYSSTISDNTGSFSFGSKEFETPFAQLKANRAAKLAAISPDRLGPEAQLEKLHEELDEVVDEVRSTNTSGAIQAERVLAEAADVAIVVTMLVRAFGYRWVDLIDAVHAKMDRNARRGWAAHNGTAQQIHM